jgi:short-subunit dehydrogenase
MYESELISFKKNIVITGATSGIGKCLVKKLDQDSNNLVLIGRSEKKLTEVSKSLKTSSTVIVIDLSETFDYSRLLQFLPTRVDGFVHAAGVESVEPLRAISYEKFNSVMRLHLYSFIEIVKAIDRNKKKSDEFHTSIVAISSIASDSGGVGQTMYSASKAALEATIKTLSKELAQKKIRLNAIKPGLVDTEMTRRWMRRIGIESIEDLNKMQINGVAQPEEIASLIKFMLSDQSSHIVGTQIRIDGGGPLGEIF